MPGHSSKPLFRQACCWLLLVLLVFICLNANSSNGKLQKLKMMKKLFKAKIILKPLIKSGAIKAPMLHLIMPMTMQSSPLNRLLDGVAAGGGGNGGGSGSGSVAANVNSGHAGAGVGGLLRGKLWPFQKSAAPSAREPAPSPPSLGAMIEANMAMYGNLMEGLNHGAARIQNMLGCMSKSSRSLAHGKRAVECMPHPAHMIRPAPGQLVPCSPAHPGAIDCHQLVVPHWEPSAELLSGDSMELPTASFENLAPESYPGNTGDVPILMEQPAQPQGNGRGEQYPPGRGHNQQYHRYEGGQDQHRERPKLQPPPPTQRYRR